MSGRLKTRHAVVVAERDTDVDLLTKDTQVSSMPLALFDVMVAVDVTGPEPMAGAAGRLWAANLAQAAGAVSARWSADAVHATAVNYAAGSLGASRAAAVDGCRLGLDQAVAGVRLTSSEKAWYWARAAASAGDTGRMVSWLGQLPLTGYPERITLLLSRAADLLRDADLGSRARALLEPLVPARPPTSGPTALADWEGTASGARLLLLALRQQASPEVVDTLLSAARHASTGHGQHAGLIVAVAEAIAGGGRIPSLPPTPSPALRALDAYRAAMAGATLNQAGALVATLPEALISDLTVAGALTAPADTATVSADAEAADADTAAVGADARTVSAGTDSGGNPTVECTSTGDGNPTPPPGQVPPQSGESTTALREVEAAAGHEYLRYLTLLVADRTGIPEP